MTVEEVVITVTLPTGKAFEAEVRKKFGGTVE